jgi:hypothetical protein
VHEQRVPVGCGLCDYVGADRPARTPAVIDQHLLAHRFSHALCHEPRHDVRGAARGEGHDDAQRSRGEFLGGSTIQSRCERCDGKTRDPR